jgi:hypothetical protein
VPPLILFLLATTIHAQTFQIATIGDSFADSLYYAMRGRPDLIRKSDVRLTRWSRPIVGLTRSDYFDYRQWLRDLPDSDPADLCFVQIGANDMQSIPVGPRKWLAYGTPPWKEAYAAATLELARLLAGRRCRQVLWVLQPGFEKREALACHRELIDQVQRETVHLDRTRLLEIETSETSYGPDRTHFNRAYLLRLGPALFQLVDSARQIDHGRCLVCHRNVDASPPARDVLPLHWRRSQ